MKSRKENILKKLDKIAFDIAVEVLRTDLKKLVENKMILISDHIENTKKKLENDLTEFFVQNKEEIFKSISLLLNDTVYIRREAENLAKETIYKIKWPKAFELISRFKITTHFSDITFEDLKNKELI